MRPSGDGDTKASLQQQQHQQHQQQAHLASLACAGRATVPPAVESRDLHPAEQGGFRVEEREGRATRC